MFGLLRGGTRSSDCRSYARTGPLMWMWPNAASSATLAYPREDCAELRVEDGAVLDHSVGGLRVWFCISLPPKRGPCKRKTVVGCLYCGLQSL